MSGWLAAAGLEDDDQPTWLSDGSSGIESDDDDASPPPPGLRVDRRALSRAARRALAAQLAACLPDIATGTVNQAMAFPGSAPLPPWAAMAAAAVDTGHWPAHLTSRGRPPFNTAAVNVYGPQNELQQHVDLPRFADGVAIVSLGGAVVFCLHKVGTDDTFSTLLRPGDILTLCGESRYGWTHGFAAGDGVWKGRRVPRARARVGVTLRWMDPAAG